MPVALCSSTLTCERPRHTFLLREMSPVDCCSFHRRFRMTLGEAVNPIGSFTDPEYAQVGLTEAQARAAHDVVTSMIHFDATTRTIIDGRTFGFCKLIVDRAT